MLEDRYYPLIGAIMSESKTVASSSGQIYLNLIICEGVMMAKGSATVWRMSSSELLADTPLDVRIDAASGTISSAVSKGAPLLSACLCLRLFAIYKTALTLSVSAMVAWCVTNLPKALGGVCVYTEGQIGWAEQHNTLAEDATYIWATKLCRAALCRLVRNTDEELIATGRLESAIHAFPTTGNFVLSDIVNNKTDIQPSTEWLETYDPARQSERRLRRARMLLKEDLSDVPLELLTDCVNLETNVDQQILESLSSSKRVLKLFYGGSFEKIAAKLRQRSHDAAIKTAKYLGTTPSSLPAKISSVLDTEFWTKTTTPCQVSVPWYSINDV
eukprot:11039-Amphidinium_carterae.2